MTPLRATRTMCVLIVMLALLSLGGGVPTSAGAVGQGALSRSIEERLPNQSFYGGYLTVEGIYAYVESTATRYPGLVEKVDIGDSWCKAHPGACVQPTSSGGYDLFVLRITNKAVAGPKPKFWFDAGIHAREIATPEMAMRFVRMLLEGYESDPDLRWIVDHQETWVMPLMNPDGYRLVYTGAPDGEPFSQRKNADNDDGCELYPPMPVAQTGTDLNRNFTFKWSCCNGSSSRACAQDYHGTSPGSEEETQAVMAAMRGVFGDQRGTADTDPAPITAAGIYQNMHSYSDMNLYPWGWTKESAPNGVDLRNIAAHASAADASPPGNSYRYCQPPECLYIADGTASDWAYGELGIPAVTTELGGGTFFPFYADVEGLWQVNRGMLVYMAKLARAPYLLNRGPDTAIVDRVISVPKGSTAQVAAAVNYGWEGNAYTQNVAGAELYMDVPPWAGGVGVPMFPTDGALNSPWEGVAANIDTSGLQAGRHTIYVRGRGAASYEGYESWGPVSAAWIEVGPSVSETGVQGTTATRSRGGRVRR